MCYAAICGRCSGSGYIEACYSCPDCDGTGIEFRDDDDFEEDEDWDDA
jgi:DnaJ-class molecular chaperone